MSNSQAESSNLRTSPVPERWLDLLTGYVEVGIVIAVCVMGIAALIK